ncbi:MAG: ornithine cyclodeaminase family protein [Candidatus Bathyarchaeota archaeon]|nr:MAG: ornithine cyclodeaminase family protein [Candidatus Bathyarchaeota archaeon]
MEKKDQVLLLTKEQIESILTMEDTIKVVEEGFKAFNSGKAVIPFPLGLEIKENRGEVHIKPGYLKGSDKYCIKIASGFYDNPKIGLPSSGGMILLFDARTGAPRSLLVDRGFITDMRTAGAGALATRCLAKKSVEAVAVIGTGLQARLQIEALSKVRDFRVLKVWGRTLANVERYVEDMRQKLKAEILPVGSAEEAVRNSEVVVTATTSTSPLVKKEWVDKGMHITAMGADSPEKQELETGVLGLADKIVVDSVKQCVKLGEVHHAVDDGTISVEDIHAELGEILLGLKSGRSSEEEITVCDLTGIAVQDVVTSQLVYERALKEKIGSYITV